MPKTYTIHITYTSQSSTSPATTTKPGSGSSTHTSQGQGKSVVHKIDEKKIKCPSTSAQNGTMKHKSILKSKSLDAAAAAENNDKQHRRVRLFLESEQTII